MGTPPVPRRVSELERPQCNSPALGPFLWPLSEIDADGPLKVPLNIDDAQTPI